ncbi:hypothetical protein V2J09_001577 [Rumex salicifolius]
MGTSEHMAAEKKGSKGKFLYLFDWHAKSRKKLFSNKSELSGGSNQATESLESSALPFHLRETSFAEDGYLTRESGNYHFGSSINEDDSYETKAPGVVARLMGLDSLPVSTAGETSSISSRDYESHAVQSSYYPRNPSGYQHDRHPVDFGYMGSKFGDYHLNSVDYRSIMVPGRPFERFQNEVLPPKSAKPISITHHKLLSPIKSPGFIPANNATYIMEAAARFTDPALPEISLLRTPSFGSSSTPIKIRDLKDKMEAAHRLAILPESSKKIKRPPSAKHLNGNSRDRLVDRSSSRTLDLETNGASSSTIKGKAVSSDVYGKDKDNARRKDMSISNSNRKLMNREHNQVNLKQSSNSQSSAKKTEHTRHSANRSSALPRQNIEKQNGKSNIDNGTSKYTITNKQPRRSIPTDGSSGTSKRVTKTLVNSEGVPKKVSTATVFPEKRPALNRMKNISRSKELQIKDRQVKGSIADDLVSKKNKKATQHDTALQTVADTKKGMDVISFTFNSPIKKSASVFQSSSEMEGSSNLLDSESRFTNDEFDSRSSPSPLLRLNLIGCDDLSLLLEQKLKELTNKVELNESQSESGRQGTDVDSVSSCSELVSRRTVVQANSVGDLERFCEDDPYSAYSEAFRREEIEEGCSSEANSIFREGHHPSHNSRNGCSSGKAQAFLHQFEEESSCISTESHPIEDERDISDTTSSSYYDEWDGKHTSTSQSMSEVYLSDWELQYVKQIVHLAGLKEIVLDADREIIDPSVFDHAENLIYISATNTGECTKLARKLLFDCLNDCLCLKYEQISVGSYSAWCRWRVVLQKEDWLVEELYKEVYSLADMENLMVDELVEKDMGIQYSGWLAFDIEALEEGMDIEQDIVDSLINEMVADLSLLL